MKDIQIGDKVVIVNYGHAGYVSKEEAKRLNLMLLNDEDYCVYDMLPEIVGQVGTVSNIQTFNEGRIVYSLEGINGKCAWYNREQLELLDK